jgi:DNA-binding transcriptional regulator YdaS (Cro superfamily)
MITVVGILPAMEALLRAVTLAGGQTALARRIGKTQSHVAQWLRRGRVGPTACIPIETAVGGQVTRYELRPDVFGKPPPFSPPQPSEAVQ